MHNIKFIDINKEVMLSEDDSCLSRSECSSIKSRRSESPSLILMINICSESSESAVSVFHILFFSFISLIMHFIWLCECECCSVLLCCCLSITALKRPACATASFAFFVDSLTQFPANIACLPIRDSELIYVIA